MYNNLYAYITQCNTKCNAKSEDGTIYPWIKNPGNFIKKKGGCTIVSPKTTAQPKMYGHHISHHYNITSVLHITEKPFALFRQDATIPFLRMHAASFLKNYSFFS